MPLNKTLLKVTDRILERSKGSREKNVGQTSEGANSVLQKKWILIKLVKKPKKYAD